jgi:stage III sporulation protein AG
MELSGSTPPVPLLQKLVQMIGLKPNQAGLIKFLVIAVALGVLFMNVDALFGLSSNKGRPQGASEVLTPDHAPDELTILEQQLGTEWSGLLSLIKGAGQVRVVITLASGPLVMPVINTTADNTTTIENTGDGAKRDTKQGRTESTNVTNKDGAVAVAQRLSAQVAGVAIFADGANNDVVRRMLQQAIVTGLHVPANRVQILPTAGR